MVSSLPLGWSVSAGPGGARDSATNGWDSRRASFTIAATTSVPLASLPRSPAATRELDEARQYEGGAMHGMALASPFDPARIDLCFLETGFSPAHVFSTGSGWDASVQEAGWDHLGGEFITAPVMVATKAARQPVNELSPGDAGPAPGPTTLPPHRVPGPLGVGPVVAGPVVAGPLGAASALGHVAAASPGPGGSPQVMASVARGVAGLGGLTPFGPRPRLDVFAVGTDFALHHQVLWDGTLSASPSWENLGGIFISAPTAATAFGETRIDVFGLGLDRALYQKTWDGQRWSHDWVRLGGIFSSDASAVSWAPGRLDVFVRGADFTLRHRAYDGTSWLNDWQNLGGSLASAPAAVAWGPDRIDILAVSHAGTLVHTWWDGMIWNAWEDLGTPRPELTLTGTPTAVSWAPHRLDVLVLGSDGVLYHYWFADGAWDGPEPLGSGETITDCAAIVTAPQALHAFKAGAGGAILTSLYDGATWAPWEQTGMHLVLPTRYVFSIDLVQVDTARSLNADTDTATATLTIGDSPATTATQSIDAIGGTHPKQWQTNALRFGPVTVELADSVVFNYQVVNQGNPDPNAVDSVMTAAGKKLADYAVQSISKSLLDGLTAIEAVEIGSVSSAVPVVGPLLGILAGWLVGEIASIFTANCDGPVALEQVVLLGRDLYRNTAAGPYRTTTTHPGTDSNSFCGDNSVYEVSWSITRA
jgi:hypothetical protein